MYNFEPFFDFIKDNNISLYSLNKDYLISKSTIDRMKHNQSITITTIDKICNSLHCDIKQVVKITT